MNLLLPLWMGLTLLASAPAIPDESEEIRILVGSGNGSLKIAGEGLVFSSLDDSAAMADGGMPEAIGEAVSLGCSADHKVRIGNRATDSSAIEVRGPATLRAFGHSLRGEIDFRCEARKWLAINVLPLEEYLSAVLDGEMPRSFPPEALKAQAVAARSYALTRKIAARDSGQTYHLGATVLSQVYAGVDHQAPEAVAAVAATRGEVLANGVDPVEAYFHSSCGGKTESGGAALGRPLSYLEPVTCACAGHSPYAHWSVTAAEKDVLEALGGRGVTGITVTSRSATGRARTVRVQSKTGTREVPATVFREALGYQRLPSLWFDVHRSGNDFVFEGRGSGHGAGLCQWGAKIMAEHGSSYREILAHYYPGTDLQKIY